MRFFRKALALGVLGLAVTVAAAQETGGIAVQVFDDQGNPLPGATVTISHETGFVKTTSMFTNAKGLAEFPVLRPGDGYAIRVSFPNFAEKTQAPIHVRIGRTETINVPMMQEMQTIEERVKVTAEREVVDLDDVSSTTKFSDDFVSDLPVPGRFYQNVLTLAPGVQDPDGDGNPVVHGSRSRDFKAQVGGIANVDPLTGQFMSNVNPNSIEEMEVITSGAGVEYGRAQGGFANIIQKQGSNEHEGVFEFYYRSSKFDGTGAQDNSNLPDIGFDWFQPAVQFSGPVIKDKLWYRLSHELRKIEIPVITASGSAVVTREEATHSDQITWQVSPRNKLSLALNMDPKDIRNFGVSSTRPTESALRVKNSGESYTLEWTAPYSPKVLFVSRLGWQDLKTGLFPNTTGAANSCGLAGDLGASYCLNSDTGFRTGSYFLTTDDHRQRLTARSDGTIYGGNFWGTSHQFKLGVIVENERYFRFLERRPSINLFTFSSLDQDNDPQSFQIALTTFGVPPQDNVRATGTNWGVYGSDLLKPLQNLSLTVGLRVDREEINAAGHEPFDPVAELQQYEALVRAGFSEDVARRQSFIAFEDARSLIAAVQAQACSGVGNPGPCMQEVDQSLSGASNDAFARRQRRRADMNITNTNFSPFLSVSWDPWNNTKTALKATTGRYYNNIALNVPLVELEPAEVDISYRVAANDFVVEGSDETTPTVSVIDRGLRTPYQDEFTFRVERQLWTETKISVGYINRKYRDQLQDRNINRATGDYGRCVRQTGPDVDSLTESPGSGQTLVDPFSGDSYVDTDPGVGDGRLDDCVGEFETLPRPGETKDKFGSNTYRLNMGDGIADLYIQNPFWGDIYLVGNSNRSDYEAFVAELTRNLYRSWELQGSYTYSESTGDGEDFNQFIGDDPSLIEDEFGYQSSDQRHVVKMSATSVTPWGIRLGSSVSWQSGLPYSLLRQKFSVSAASPLLGNIAPTSARARTVYRTGVRNDQRNDSYWLFDVKATKELTLGRGVNMQISAEIFNLFADDTYTVYNDFFDVGYQINGNNDAYYRFGREWQFGLKLSF